MRQSSVKIADNIDIATSFTSQGINLISIYAYSIQAVHSGTAAGTFKLQGSNDPGDNGSGQGVSQPTNWTDISDSPQAVSGAGSVLWDVTECSYRWVRMIYTATSGTGTLNAIINTKGI